MLDTKHQHTARSLRHHQSFTSQGGVKLLDFYDTRLGISCEGNGSPNTGFQHGHHCGRLTASSQLYIHLGISHFWKAHPICRLCS